MFALLKKKILFLQCSSLVKTNRYHHSIPHFLRGHNDFFDIITISTRMNLESNYSTLTPLPPLEGSEKIMISMIKCGQGWFEYIIANFFVPSILWCFYIPLVHIIGKKKICSKNFKYTGCFTRFDLLQNDINQLPEKIIQIWKKFQVDLEVQIFLLQFQFSIWNSMSST
jgi:hypothetical protein